MFVFFFPPNPLVHRFVLVTVAEQSATAKGVSVMLGVMACRAAVWHGAFLPVFSG